jgi:hypothetical protein
MCSRSKTVISPAWSFSEDYNGALVEFRVNPSAGQRLADIGVRDNSPIVREEFPDMPPVSKGGRRTRRSSRVRAGQAQAVEACASTSSVNSSEGFFQL